MRLLTFTTPGLDPRRTASWRLGVLVPEADAVIDVAAAFAAPGDAGGGQQPPEYLDWCDIDGPWHARARRIHELVLQDPGRLTALRESGVSWRLPDVEVLAPVPRPGKVVCVGLNYRDHAREAKMEVPTSPVIVAKFPTSVVGSGAPIVLPAGDERIDFEAELGVVIGRRVRDLSEADALSCVCGYLNANDVSARGFQKLDGQWVRAKSCDTFAPMGPALVTADEVPDPGALDIRLRLNGEEMQHSNTDEFVFSIPALLAFLSATMTLEPGDVVLTGTPPGVGFARQPPVYLQPGDVVEVEIEGLGVLRNPVVGEGYI